MIKIVLLAAAVFIAACGGGATATPARTTGLPQATGAAPTVGSVPTQAAASLPPAPAPGGGTVTVTLSGGSEHDGTYTGSETPNCTADFIGEGTWGVQYSIATAGAADMSSYQLVYRDEDTDDSGQMFEGVSLLTTVTIGPIVSADSTSYEIEVRTDGEESSGQGSVDITDNGATAVIHVVGTTADGVNIDATVNCPSVMRG